MPNKQSAKKRLRQNKKLRIKNQQEKRSIKTHIKSTLSILKDEKANDTALKNSIAETESKIDRGWKHSVFHKNKAARLKSRLMTKVNKKSVQKESA